MPRYLSMHSLACLTRQGAEQLTMRVMQSGAVQARRVQVSLYDGKMLLEFDSPGREVLDAWLKSEGFHYDWLIRVELESRNGKLIPAE